MLSSIDKFFGKQFDARDYNCWHLCCEAWLDITGERLEDYTPAAWTTRSLTNAATGAAGMYFERLPGPRDPCIVMMLHPRRTPHLGIFIRGNVLHLRESGTEYQPVLVASLGFREVRYYAPCKH